MFYEHGLNEPKFESIENGFLVTVWNKRETTQETILKLLEQSPKYIRNDFARLTHKSNSTMKIHLAELKKNGRIERVGSTKGGHWKVIKDA